MPSPKAVLAGVRQKRPFVDHSLRAFGRYQADAGDRQAAAVTFFGFLSFFPILALATSILSYVLGDEAVGTVVREVNAYAPGLAEQLGLEEILSDNRKAGAAGAIGLVGLLYSGLGWVDALREAIRAIWHHNVKEGNFLVKKAKDVVILVGLGVTILLSIAISAATGAASDFLLETVRLDDKPVATAATWLLGVVLGLLTSAGLFLFLFWRLPKVQSPFRRVIKGALLAAVLFELLKRVGAFYIERTTENPLYGSFAVVVGLLVWINIVSRMLLICAAWVVTAPYDSDIEPSGTANAETAIKAGIPTEFADNDPDDPPNLQEEGAPSPLAAAVQGMTPSQDVPEGRGSTSAQAPADRGGSRVEALKQDGGGGVATLERPEPAQQGKAELVVRQAAQFTAGAMGMAAMAVLLHVGKTVR
ncbi:MAG: ribonuclease, partial [Frankiales bacterium]|nr:ribonuclease [Frankiales bacterium]